MAAVAPCSSLTRFAVETREKEKFSSSHLCCAIRYGDRIPGVMARWEPVLRELRANRTAVRVGPRMVINLFIWYRERVTKDPGLLAAAMVILFCRKNFPARKWKECFVSRWHLLTVFELMFHAPNPQPLSGGVTNKRPLQWPSIVLVVGGQPTSFGVVHSVTLFLDFAGMSIFLPVKRSEPRMSRKQRLRGGSRDRLQTERCPSRQQLDPK